MNRRPLLTRLSLWWLRNYEHCVRFWPPFMFCLVLCALFAGISNDVPLRTLCVGIFAGGIILNAGVYFIIITMKTHLLNLPDSPEREEAHRGMVNIILRRLKRGH